MIDFGKLGKAKRVVVEYLDVNVDSEFVKTFRKRNFLTQVALANLMGVTKKTIEKWEQGVNKVSGSSAVLLTLLDNEPNLIDKLYKVTYVDKADMDYETIAKSLFSTEFNSFDKVEFKDRSIWDSYVAITPASKQLILNGV